MTKIAREKTSITAHEILLTERDLSLALASATTLNDVLPRCLDTAIRLSGMDSGGIYLVDQKSGDLDLFCSSGLSGEFIRETTHIPGDSASARMVFTRKTFIQHIQRWEFPSGGHGQRKDYALSQYCLYFIKSASSPVLISHHIHWIQYRSRADRSWRPLPQSSVTALYGSRRKRRYRRARAGTGALSRTRQN